MKHYKQQKKMVQSRVHREEICLRAQGGTH